MEVSSFKSFVKNKMLDGNVSDLDANELERIVLRDDNKVSSLENAFVQDAFERALNKNSRFDFKAVQTIERVISSSDNLGKISVQDKMSVLRERKKDEFMSREEYSHTAIDILNTSKDSLTQKMEELKKVKTEALMSTDVYYKTAKQLILNSKENPISEVLNITKQLKLESPVINKEYKDIVKQVLLTSKDSKTARYLALEKLYKESALLTPTEYTELKKNILNPSAPSGGPITMKPNKL